MARATEKYDEQRTSILGKSIKLAGVKGDTYYEALIYNGPLADRDIIDLLSTTIGETDFVVDVGANIGYMTLAMGMLAPKGKVFAFEPGTKTFKILKKNISINRIKNVTLSDLGLSDTKSTSKLTYSLSNSSGAFINKDVIKDTQSTSTGAFVNNGVVEEDGGLGSDTIRLSKLDDEYKKLGITKCSLLKVDVEGHEPNFLRGANKFIEKFKPQLIMEVNHWCLNVFNRTSLPDFIALAYKNFPHLFAFQDGEYLDLSDEESRYKFYFENVVNNRFFNVYGGFNRNEMLSRLNSAISGLAQTHKLIGEKHSLEQTVISLENQVNALTSSRAHKTAVRINKLLGR